MLSVGDKVPSFSLPTQDGTTVSSASLKGTTAVIYFYPKDNTPGCTQEACDFRDQHAKFKKQNVKVFGVSPDSGASHTKFIGKFGLPFELLVDADHAVAEKFGAWGEKSLYGRKFMGIIRSTFIVDASGKISHVWPKVKVNGHVDEVLAALSGSVPEKKPAAKKSKGKTEKRA